MTQHSRISASSAHRWMACPGSVRMIGNLSKLHKSFNRYAEEGNLVHSLAAQFLLGKGTLDEFFDEIVPAHAIKTMPEMKEAIGLYADTVEKYARGCDLLLVEQRLHLAKYHPDLYGTADAVIVRGKTLYVFDLKYGQGIGIEVRDNPQLMYYALGALLMYAPADVDNVIMGIIQPRYPHPDGPVRMTSMAPEELRKWGELLKEAAYKTDKSDAELVPGGHCRYCPAAAFCPALNAVADEASKMDTTGVSKETLEENLQKVPAVEAWLKAVNEMAYQFAIQGNCPRGHKLVRRMGRRAWIEEKMPLLLEALTGEGLDEADIYERDIRSPAQLEKVLGKGSKEMLKPFIMTKVSGYSVVPESDRRPAVSVSAETDFTVVSTDNLED